MGFRTALHSLSLFIHALKIRACHTFMYTWFIFPNTKFLCHLWTHSLISVFNIIYPTLCPLHSHILWMFLFFFFYLFYMCKIVSYTHGCSLLKGLINIYVFVLSGGYFHLCSCKTTLKLLSWDCFGNWILGKWDIRTLWFLFLALSTLPRKKESNLKLFSKYELILESKAVSK